MFRGNWIIGMRDFDNAGETSIVELDVERIKKKEKGIDFMSNPLEAI